MNRTHVLLLVSAERRLSEKFIINERLNVSVLSSFANSNVLQKPSAVWRQPFARVSGVRSGVPVPGAAAPLVHAAGLHKEDTAHAVS